VVDRVHGAGSWVHESSLNPSHRIGDLRSGLKIGDGLGGSGQLRWCGLMEVSHGRWHHGRTPDELELPLRSFDFDEVSF
jgi:hypothetical protein